MSRVMFTASLILVVACMAFVYTYFSPVSSAQNANNQQNRKFQRAERGPGKKMVVDKAGIQRLKDRTGGTVNVATSEATGAARFIKFSNGRGNLASVQGANARAKSDEFFRQNGSIFGIDRDGVEMRFDNETADAQGNKHQTYKQFYKGVPVFAGIVKTHFDGAEQLNTVNGTAVPQIDVDTNPTITQQSAVDTAVALVADQKGEQNLTAQNVNMYVYRTGLVEGVPGDDHLVYEIEVTNGANLREFVYVDAHSNEIVDQFTGVYDALNRRAYNGNGSTLSVPPNYPNTPFWVEGQPFPTVNAEANNMITSSKETYDFYFTAFGRDSFNGAGRTMDSIFNRGNACPNASWNGTFISFCPGLTVDDVTAHEWSHAYTQFTHGLIYAYQPGALNEAYSDIFGETVDRLNGRDNIGNSSDDPSRTADSCSTYSPSAPRFFINSPSAIAGPYGIGRALFGPGYTATGVTADVVLVQDASNASGPLTTDGCTALTNASAVAGKIALVDRGTCTFKTKTRNAQDAGAIGVIITNVATSANSYTNMSDDATITTPITIPTVQVLYSTGTAIRSQLGTGVNASIKATNNTDASTRWLVGEDSTAVGLTGALRDMYNPTCYANPAKVSDIYYTCDIYPGSDNGGVHTNSGVPNHAYALLVDGGTFNGQTVNAIGLTKAAHIYFRAESVYQVSTSNFADHADSIEQAALDLANSGTNLTDLKTGQPSGEVVTMSDVDQVKKAMIAVEMRKPPTQCGVNSILGKNPPADPVYTAGKKTLLSDDFESGTTSFTQSREMVSPNAAARTWVLSNDLPARPGTAVFVADPNYSCAATAVNQTGVLHLESPAFVVPGDIVGTRLKFDQRLGSELGYDGGQVMISTDGGATFTPVPDTAFIYNPYNSAFLATGNTNPRAGQKAFTGNDDGYSNGVGSSWGTSIIDLTGLVTAGQTVKLRWDFSNDNCGGASYYGWFVDNISVYGGWIDSDGDGVTDADDHCPDTNLNQATVVVGSSKFSQTGVPNKFLSSGCTFQQLIDGSKSGAENHGTYVNRVDILTDQWVAAGLITDAQKGAIMRAVAQDK